MIHLLLGEMSREHVGSFAQLSQLKPQIIDAHASASRKQNETFSWWRFPTVGGPTLHAAILTSRPSCVNRKSCMNVFFCHLGGINISATSGLSQKCLHACVFAGFFLLFLSLILLKRRAHARANIHGAFILDSVSENLPPKGCWRMFRRTKSRVLDLKLPNVPL